MFEEDIFMEEIFVKLNYTNLVAKSIAKLDYAKIPSLKVNKYNIIICTAGNTRPNQPVLLQISKLISSKKVRSCPEC